MRCPKCEHDNPRDARFCEGCGNSLELGAPGGTRRVLLPLIVIAIVAISVGYALFRVSTTPDEEAYTSQVTPGRQTTPMPKEPRPAMISTDVPIARIEGFAPLTVNLKPVVIEGAIEPGALSYFWEFLPGEPSLSDETGGRAKYTYNVPGTYTPKLAISDTAGDIARQAWEIIVLPEEAREIIEKLGLEPRDASLNWEFSQVYFGIGATMRGLYFAMRSFLADGTNPDVISALAENFDGLTGHGEYVHFFLKAGVNLPDPLAEFSEILLEKTSGWIEKKNEYALQSRNSIERAGTSIYNHLQVLSSLHEYEDALNLILELGREGKELNNLSWYSLNLGRLDDAERYASRKLSDEPNDPYALEFKAFAQAMNGDLEGAREYLAKYASTNPQRGHVVSYVMDALIFADRGLGTEFAWEILDTLDVFT